MFKTYVTDSFHLIGQNKCIARRWYDIARPKVYKDIDANAIVNDVVERAGLVIG